MSVASTNAAVGAVQHPRFETGMDSKSRFLKSYRPRTPPPGTAPDAKPGPGPSRPVPKNLLLPRPAPAPPKAKPRPEPPPEGPTADQVKAFMEKKLREKAKLLSRKMEKEKKAKEKFALPFPSLLPS